MTTEAREITTAALPDHARRLHELDEAWRA